MNRRIAVIGPHRRRTGTGPFVAAFLARSGCEALAWGRAEAALLLDANLRRPEADAVCICSPPETHLAYLEAAVNKGLHVFCEKPIVWPQDHACAAFPAIIDRLSDALDRAASRGLTVHENTQWIYTLGDFERLAGGIEVEEVSHFRCEMSPSESSPAEMTMESSAHGNSLLLALGVKGMEDLSVRYDPGEASGRAELDFEFRSRTPRGLPVDVQYHFAQHVAQPRHAAYEINHRRVERRVDVDGYRIWLRHGAKETMIQDPLHASLADFLTRITSPPAGRESCDRILDNIRMSYTLLEAASGITHA
ncbi:MAG TPA: Gfo/Idh/MocA family oxidoreductase [Bryobacteraceae bacterium]|nr:Gfo/Idh/MocA family oxidoreductase [Bryobacteraceae bacterium]